MFAEHRRELVDGAVALPDDLVDMLPVVVVGVHRRCEVVEEEVLPLAAVYPVALPSRENSLVRSEFLQTVDGIRTAIDTVSDL